MFILKKKQQNMNISNDWVRFLVNNVAFLKQLPLLYYNFLHWVSDIYITTHRNYGKMCLVDIN